MDLVYSALLSFQMKVRFYTTNSILGMSLLIVFTGKDCRTLPLQYSESSAGRIVVPTVALQTRLRWVSAVEGCW